MREETGRRRLFTVDEAIKVTSGQVKIKVTSGRQVKSNKSQVKSSKVANQVKAGSVGWIDR